jgi:endonuclease/exonuclease/phosphatase family metal-dependent hydrolase
LRWLQRHFAGGGAAPPTFPSRCPLFRLDRIWVSAPARLARVHVQRTALARRASDHLPLACELRWD